MAIIERLRRDITPEPVKNRELVALCAQTEIGDLALGLILYEIQFVDRSLYRDYTDALPICLKYVMTANSNASAEVKAIEEQRVIARAVQILNDNPVIKKDNNFLGENDLPISIILENISLDEKLKIWTNTGGVFKVSVFFSVSPIFIDCAQIRGAVRVKQG